ncbi:hypothetical protein M8J77_011231 [Diaphorina citri]|nr:hypothetical protein M8J77_011231 [Diaphorina citri]
MYHFSGYPVSVSGMVTIPVSASMYQTVVANIQQIHAQGDGTMQIVPAMHVKGDGSGQGNNGGDVETITVTPHQIVAMGNGGEAQVLQVISLKDGAAFTKALQVQMASAQDIKTEDVGGGGQGGLVGGD